MRRLKGLFILSVIFVLLSSGCLGFFEGYGEKAQEYSSADYTIGTYKAFIQKYNAICNTGSTAEHFKKELDDFIELKGGIERAPYWSVTENRIYSDKLSDYNGYVAMYNRLVSEYHSMTEDKTQDWLKIAGLPEYISDYTDNNHLTNEDTIDDRVFGSEILGK